MNSAHPRNNSAYSLSVADLRHAAEAWLLDSEFRQVSEQTLWARRNTVTKLLWWLEREKLQTCGTLQIKQFLVYVSTGHEDENGRWDNPQQTRKARPATVATYFARLKTFFAFAVADGYVESSPMAALRPPIARADQITPFTADQVRALLAASRETRHARRDEAIVLFLLDTGVRVSELCALTVGDLDIAGRRCRVLGKGNKHRNVFFSAPTAKALHAYLRRDADREATAPLFTPERGGEPMSRSGVQQLIRRLGQIAGLDAVRCSPHTFRHTFAIEFLRAGGNAFSLRELLGHAKLEVTQRYLLLAQADVAQQHRQFSPVESLRRKGARR